LKVDSSDDEVAQGEEVAQASGTKQKPKSKPNNKAASLRLEVEVPAFIVPEGVQRLEYNASLRIVGQPVAQYFKPKKGVEPSANDWWTGHITKLLKEEVHDQIYAYLAKLNV
jgi:hypothetical protein